MKKRHLSNSYRTGYLLSAGLLALVLSFAWMTGMTQAVAPADPYADAVNDTRPVVAQPDNAVGAPNGTSAALAGLGASLTLDMGEGEEGNKTLRIYFGQINASATIEVEFLGANQAVILQSNKPVGADVNPSTQDFSYDSANFNGQVYRYVRLSVMIGAGVNIDAVEALGYGPVAGGTNTNTSTNTNSGGTNTNTTVTNTNTSSNGNTNTTRRTNTNTTRGNSNTSNGTGATNGAGNTNSAVATTDTDSDGMPDDWEIAHGLNPNDPADANGDPDGDYLTNRGEYEYGSDPNVADDLSKLICKEKAEVKDTNGQDDGTWAWLIVAFLLGGSIAWFAKSVPKKSKKTTTMTSVK